MDRAQHWDRIHSTRPHAELSWYQREPALSLSLIREFVPASARVIDVGGGASVLVDHLLSAGYARPAVLDVSAAAIERAKSRLGERADRVEWIVADVCATDDVGKFNLWHDRAMFHFLVDSTDRRKYVDLARRTVVPGGHLILATFAIDGPTQCSGLEIQRHGAESASAELRPAFSLVRQADQTHITPQGKPQRFFFAVFERTHSVTSSAAEAPR